MMAERMQRNKRQMWQQELEAGSSRLQLQVGSRGNKLEMM